MTLTPANPIAIKYETFGEPTAPPVLLIMGLGGQLIHWDEAFCRLLAGLGRYVIRFDNRDVGLSTKLDELSAPDTRQSVRARLEGRSPEPPIPWMIWPMMLSDYSTRFDRPPLTHSRHPTQESG